MYEPELTEPEPFFASLEPGKVSSQENPNMDIMPFLWCYDYMWSTCMCSAKMVEKAREDDGEFSFHFYHFNRSLFLMK